MKFCIVDSRFGAEEAYTYRLDVADDGVGLPAGFEWEGGESLGRKLVVILTRQLWGEITAAEATTGAHFILRFTADDDSVAYSMIELHCTQQTRCPPPCCVRLRMPLRKHFSPPPKRNHDCLTGWSMTGILSRH
jgi:hypothetical protein